MSIASQSLGIPGSTIDFKQDLGLTDQHFPEVHLELRPATRHKFRLQYIPINYEQTGVLTRTIVFNGQLYRVGLPVDSTLDWKAYRFGYEYDFISRDRGFGGFLLEAKYTEVTATLASAIVTRVHAGQGADSSDWRHRPLLSGAQHLDHGRSHWIQPAGEGD